MCERWDAAAAELERDADADDVQEELESSVRVIACLIYWCEEVLRNRNSHAASLCRSLSACRL